MEFFKLTEAVTKEQVEGYETLPFSKRYRGRMVIFFVIVFAISIGFTAVHAFDEIVSFDDVFISMFMYWPLIIFGYRGSKISLILLGILWTVDKALILYYSHSVLMNLLWWAVGIGYIVHTYRIAKLVQQHNTIQRETV